MRHRTHAPTRLHPDVARLVQQAACWRITMAYLMIGLAVVILLALFV